MLRDDVRVALRVRSTMTDVEVDALIAAAVADMRRIGIREELLDLRNMSDLAKFAVIAFCKANYGFDNTEGPTYFERYKWCVTALANSSMNETLYEPVEETTEGIAEDTTGTCGCDCNG
jgi:hypothetical protein